MKKASSAIPRQPTTRCSPAARHKIMLKNDYQACQPITSDYNQGMSANNPHRECSGLITKIQPYPRASRFASPTPLAANRRTSIHYCPGHLRRYGPHVRHRQRATRQPRRIEHRAVKNGLTAVFYTAQWKKWWSAELAAAGVPSDSDTNGPH